MLHYIQLANYQYLICWAVLNTPYMFPRYHMFKVAPNNNNNKRIKSCQEVAAKAILSVHSNKPWLLLSAIVRRGFNLSCIIYIVSTVEYLKLTKISLASSAPKRRECHTCLARRWNRNPFHNSYIWMKALLREF